MKVNIGTLVITDDQAFGVGLAEGEFRKGTRKEIKDRLLAVVTGHLNELAAPVSEMTKNFDLAGGSAEIFDD